MSVRTSIYHPHEIIRTSCLKNLVQERRLGMRSDHKVSTEGVNGFLQLGPDISKTLSVLQTTSHLSVATNFLMTAFLFCQLDTLAWDSVVCEVSFCPSSRVLQSVLPPPKHPTTEFSNLVPALLIYPLDLPSLKCSFSTISLACFRFHVKRCCFPPQG